MSLNFTNKMYGSLLSSLIKGKVTFISLPVSQLAKYTSPCLLFINTYIITIFTLGILLVNMPLLG